MPPSDFMPGKSGTSRPSSPARAPSYRYLIDKRPSSIHAGHPANKPLTSWGEPLFGRKLNVLPSRPRDRGELDEKARENAGQRAELPPTSKTRQGSSSRLRLSPTSMPISSSSTRRWLWAMHFSYRNVSGFCAGSWKRCEAHVDISIPSLDSS